MYLSFVAQPLRYQVKMNKILIAMFKKFYLMFEN